MSVKQLPTTETPSSHPFELIQNFTAETIKCIPKSTKINSPNKTS